MIEALNYGVGSLLSFQEGRAADMFGAKRVGMIGNSFIPLLSFTGFPATYTGAGLLFSSG